MGVSGCSSCGSGGEEGVGGFLGGSPSEYVVDACAGGVALERVGEHHEDDDGETAYC